MRFIIGDIHGEIYKLKQLISHIQQIDKNSHLIFIGDYINKGENSKETLSFLLTLPNSIFLMGNHEYYLLEFLKNRKFKEKVLQYGEKTTFIDFNTDITNLKEKIYLPYKSFFDNLQIYYETNKYFISHAGIDTTYINSPLKAIPLEKFILNNRYEFIKSSVKRDNKKFIFGHTGFTHPYVDDTKIGIDTSAVYAKENPLTAFCLDEEFFINSFNEKTHLKEYPANICPNIIRKPPYREEENL